MLLACGITRQWNACAIWQICQNAVIPVRPISGWMMLMHRFVKRGKYS